ncbi:MAG: ABC transporter ATP-binding protein [Myxococcales bacterium]
MAESSSPLLQVRDLVVSFRTDSGELRAVDGVSFDVPRGSTVGLVGESGSGKSVTALSLLGLLPRPAGRVASGSILFEGRELAQADEKTLRQIRGQGIGMIFQEPMTALNPVFSVGHQIMEAVRAHRRLSRADARARAIDLLGRVGIPAARERADAYPHELSGGMRQRVMIAIALAAEPKLLIADEPTTALDVTIQAQILDLLSDLQRDFGMSILLITHDLGVVFEHTESVVVMYAGKVAEQASTRDLFRHPLHPYTRGLLASVPSYAGNLGKPLLHVIPGMVPDLRRLPVGCRFQERCARAQADCREREPALEHFAHEQRAACFHVHQEEAAP